MLRRVVVGLLGPLFLLAAVGCGGGGSAESPKVENPTVKVKALDNTKPGEGPKMKAD
jgi:hypothetical protein